MDFYIYVITLHVSTLVNRMKARIYFELWNRNNFSFREVIVKEGINY